MEDYTNPKITLPHSVNSEPRNNKMNHFQDEENRNDQTDACVNIRGYFKQYCASSSIHGFQYLGEERSVFERIWWITVFIIVLSGCSFMIYKIYEKYETSPVIVSFATKDTPIYKIPFPSITICPVTKSVKEKFDYEKVTQKKTQGEVLTPNEEKYLQIMSLLCDDYDFETEAGNNSFINDYFDVLDEIKPDFLGNAINCKLMGDDYDCKDLFVPIMTDEGVCYSFNILDRRHIFSDLVSHYKGYHHVEDEDEEKWNMEKGYFDGVSIETYPKRALLAGASKGFNVDLVTSRQDLDYSCHAMQGFKVVLHSAVRIPKLKQEYFRLPLDQAVVVAVQPVMITTSEEVKSFDPEKRDCYFPSEISLKYFKSYSQQNCQLECITNATLHECDCVDIFMPRDNRTEICGTGSFECVQDIRVWFQYLELALKFPSDRENFKDFIEDDEGLLDCDCRPLCTDLSYHGETSQTAWKWEEKFRLLNETKYEKNLTHMSRLTVYFKVNHFITSERQELYGPIDFVANFGGLLGLFTGFSIFSVMEIIYFLTVRICCNIRLYGRWSGISK